MPPDDEEPTDTSDNSVLSPDDLDITRDEHVAEIDDGRFLISPSGPAPDTEPEEADDLPPQDATGPPPRDVYEWLSSRAASTDATYGFDITAKFDDRVEHQQLYSNDVTTTFENLLVWYAQYVGGDTPVEDVLGILLMESNVPVRYPPSTIRNLVNEIDLNPDDTVEELLAHLSGTDGIRFPTTDNSMTDQ